MVKLSHFTQRTERFKGSFSGNIQGNYLQICLKLNTMITLKEAQNICGSEEYRPNTEILPLNEVLNRILAEDVYSDVNMPPFHKAAVDGFACRKSDLQHDLLVIGEVAAGSLAETKLQPKSCFRIMTGAPVPDGCDIVIMLEHTQVLPNGRIRFMKEKSSQNICFLGEDVQVSDLLLSAGTLLRSQDIGVLASAGKSTVSVFQSIRVGIIATGNELVEPHCLPNPSQIRNSNGPMIEALVQSLGAKAINLGIAPDQEAPLETIIERSLRENHLTILSGGVSVGDYDLVPIVLKKLQVETRFHSVAVQPGKPSFFGKRGNSLVFGLPGNPVSSFVQFNLLVKNLIRKLAGQKNLSNETIRIPLSYDYQRRNVAREKWEPAQLNENGEIKALNYHGSGHLHALSFAKVLFQVPAGVASLRKGELVQALII